MHKYYCKYWDHNAYCDTENEFEKEADAIKWIEESLNMGMKIENFTVIYGYKVQLKPLQHAVKVEFLRA